MTDTIKTLTGIGKTVQDLLDILVKLDPNMPVYIKGMPTEQLPPYLVIGEAHDGSRFLFLF